MSFDEPVGGSFAADDVVPVGSLAASAATTTVVGTDPDYTVQLFLNGETLDGALGFDIPAGGASDALGNLSLAAAAPSYTIAESGVGGLAGDVNKDAAVNAADVTLLADHIVNGTPLP